MTPLVGKEWVAFTAATCSLRWELCKATGEATILEEGEALFSGEESVWGGNTLRVI